ncbi:MAG: TerC family protein [Betaproteobacteria bacterium]|nr:TerC family protein [Betaproteobacteria bacterium]
MSADFWLILGQIIAVNLLLSGDNAAIIALAARQLPMRQRRWAVWGGSGAAVILRIGLTWVAALLLEKPGLAALGGGLLLWVAYRLVTEEGQQQEQDAPEAAGGGWRALRIILVADLLMSLDNVLSLAALAHHNETLLVLGLLTSVPFIVMGSHLLLRLFERYPWLIRLGGALLAQVAGHLLVQDRCWKAFPWLLQPWVDPVFSWSCALFMGLLPGHRPKQA